MCCVDLIAVFPLLTLIKDVIHLNLFDGSLFLHTS